MAASWETAWFPAPIDGIADRPLAVAVGLATLAHAVHAGIRPAALLPVEVDGNDPFVMALRRIRIRKRAPAAGANPLPEGSGARAIIATL